MQNEPMDFYQARTDLCICISIKLFTNHKCNIIVTLGSNVYNLKYYSKRIAQWNVDVCLIAFFFPITLINVDC